MYGQGFCEKIDKWAFYHRILVKEMNVQLKKYANRAKGHGVSQRKIMNKIKKFEDALNI